MSQELLENYIRTGDIPALKDLLLSNPSLATVKTSHKVSPLMLSCYFKKPDISALILKHVSEPDIYESAAVGKFDSLANIVYKHPELINTFSEDGFTPLGLACYFEHEEIARFLLLKGAEVNIPSRNDFGVYPIHSSVASNNADITKILLEAGAEVNVEQQAGITPLHSAAHNGHIEIIVLLLEAGAYVSSLTTDGKTPADMASAEGFNDIARILTE